MKRKQANKDIEKPIAFKILRVFSLTPILLWPIIFFGTVFFFDDPNTNTAVVYFAFFAINAYPLYLVGNLILSNKIYKWNSKISVALLIWPLALFGFLISYVFLN